MALDSRYSNFSVNDMIDAWSPEFNTGYLRIYDGTIPTNADTAVGAQVLLAELRFNATAFGAASAGVATANAFTADSAANATGTATWFRALRSDGTTVLMDGTVGTSNANLVINSTAIQVNAEVQVNSMTVTLPKSGT
jgi:RES domain-containing protein